MLSGIVALLAFSVLGNILSEWWHLPVPGAVTGLLLMVIYLKFQSRTPEVIDKASQFCIRYMIVLFIPAGVGVFFMTGLLQQQWLPLVLIIFIATPLSLLLTAMVMQLFLKKDNHSTVAEE
ncbi:Holin-like protein CidA [invertebrate metagenome]|uniref:Holin-like protein CidA n=1 Tax=invertebrate metagenome TaxID=1711999 RepID=A0A2H9TB11_9ZZZZ